ncbi:restriction endonuclease subunit S [Duncaniella muricolitica]|uniref:restriction endonuclease subunit S n=3 Tax=Duncaniella TaxID=2518495 RepID=UPI00244DB593|nr:restriction endonuclease subunit S [Duncaniella muricolitica]
MDTQKLRQRILDLAIRGKLLPQDPNDEPASVLLDRIRAEKERLIAEGKLKRPKAKKSTDKSHYQNFTPPFDIPESWQWVKIDEIASSNIGLTYSPQDIVDDGVPVYRSNNIRDNKICLDDIVYVSCPILEKQYLNNGDLLICARNGSRRLVGKNVIIENLERPTSFGAFMAVCRSCYNPWIKLLLDSAYFNSYLDESNSTAINQITQKMLLDFILPLPPKEEQSRIISAFHSIVGVIDGIDQSKKNLSESIANLKSKILDLAMQGKLVPQDPADEPAAEMLRRVNPKAKIITDNPHSWNIPNTWTWCQLGDIFQHNTGKALNSSNRDGIEYEYITTSNVYWNRFELDDLKKMPFKKNELEKCTVRHGDLLVCEGGDVGRAAIWNLDRNIMIQNHLHRLRPIANEIHIPLYYHVFRHYKDKDLIGGKGIALQGFSSKSLHQLAIPLPPYNEQKRIVAKIEELYSVLDQIEASLQS